MRIEPLPPGPMPDDVRVALKGWVPPDASEVPKPLDTFARHPDLARAFLRFNSHLFHSTLSPRTRELLILRTAAICGNSFERDQHEIAARNEGIDEETIARTVEGPEAAGWSPDDGILVRAVDELLFSWTISDATWAALGQSLDDRQLMDLAFTVGSYALLGMAFNAFGVRSDPS